jgi:hypothetical protein
VTTLAAAAATLLHFLLLRLLLMHFQMENNAEFIGYGEWKSMRYAKVRLYAVLSNLACKSASTALPGWCQGLP